MQVPSHKAVPQLQSDRFYSLQYMQLGSMPDVVEELVFGVQLQRTLSSSVIKLDHGFKVGYEGLSAIVVKG